MGDFEEIERLYRSLAPQLVGTLTAIGGSRRDAEEIAQDAFLQLLRHWDKVRGYDSVEGWVRTVAIRRLISRHRRYSVQRLGLLRMASMPAPDVHPIDEMGVVVDQALRQLSVGHRAVLVLHYVCDLQVDEIADLLSIRVGTVKSRLSRARAALAPLLSDEEGADDEPQTAS
jgi:RNA polymerase sigma-70 factor (ECF subfamily)